MVLGLPNEQFKECPTGLWAQWQIDFGTIQRCVIPVPSGNEMHSLVGEIMILLGLTSGGCDVVC